MSTEATTIVPADKATLTPEQAHSAVTIAQWMLATAVREMRSSLDALAYSVKVTQDRIANGGMPDHAVGQAARNFAEALAKTQALVQVLGPAGEAALQATLKGDSR